MREGFDYSDAERMAREEDRAQNLPSVDQVLNTLDFEINRITSEDQRPGWTVWALCGGILSGLWLITEQWETGKAEVIRVMYVFLTLSLAVGFIFSGFRLFFILYYKPRRFFKIRSYFELVTPTQILLGALWDASLLFITLVLRDSLGPLLSSIIFLIYGMALVSNGSILVIGKVAGLTYFGPVDTPFGRRALIAAHCFSVLILILLLWACARLITLALSLHTESGLVTDIRIGGLLVVILVLMSMLAGHSRSDPLLTTLGDIRQRLALGNMPLGEAIAQADLAISGMKVDRFLRSNIDDWLKYVEGAGAAVQEMENALERLKDELPEKDEDITEEHMKLLVERLKPLIPTFQHYAKHKAYTAKAIRRIERRARWYGLWSKEAEGIAEEVINKINNSRIEGFRRAERAFNVMSGVLKRVAKDKPEVYEKFVSVAGRELEKRRKKVGSLESFK